MPGFHGTHFWFRSNCNRIAQAFSGPARRLEPRLLWQSGAHPEKRFQTGGWFEGLWSGPIRFFHVNLWTTLLPSRSLLQVEMANLLESFGLFYESSVRHQNFSGSRRVFNRTWRRTFRIHKKIVKISFPSQSNPKSFCFNTFKFWLRKKALI